MRKKLRNYLIISSIRCNTIGDDSYEVCEFYLSIQVKFDDKVNTKNPKLIQMMTVVAMEMAARLSSPRWPAKD